MFCNVFSKLVFFICCLMRRPFLTSCIASLNGCPMLLFPISSYFKAIFGILYSFILLRLFLQCCLYFSTLLFNSSIILSFGPSNIKTLTECKNFIFVACILICWHTIIKRQLSPYNTSFLYLCECILKFY